jgi:2-phospho-L-lactate guanylyltransferase
MNDAFVLPLKAFDLAKGRLRVSGSQDVTQLARTMALAVLQSCGPRHVVILSESDTVTRFAEEHGVEVLESKSRSLNEAVQSAYESLAGRYERLIVVHGDLRDPSGLHLFDPEPGVTIVTDHHGSGTNVLALPTSVEFRFRYGSDSAHHHEAEARRLGLDVYVIADSPWRFDVDEPSDLI